MDMGNYDECININKVISDGDNIQGKYCIAEIPITSLTIKIAVCFPSTCSTANMDTFLAQIMNRMLNMTLTGELVSESTCKTSDRDPLDGLAIFTM